MSKISEKKVTKENAMGNRLEAITKKIGIPVFVRPKLHRKKRCRKPKIYSFGCIVLFVIMK